MASVGVATGPVGAGDDDHRNDVLVAVIGDRLGLGVNQPRRGCAAGLEPDGQRSPGRRLARELGDRPELALRLEEDDGDAR